MADFSPFQMAIMRAGTATTPWDNNPGLGGYLAEAQQQAAQQRYYDAQAKVSQSEIENSQRIKEMMANIDLTDPAALQQLMRVDPKLAIDLMQQQRLMREQEMMEGIFTDGLPTGGVQSGSASGFEDINRLATVGAISGNKNLVDLAGMKQQQLMGSPEYKAQMELATKKAATDAENIKSLESAANKFPELVATTNRLKELAQEATYTEAGKGVDWLAKQAGIETPGATARVEFNAVVKNQILPMLKQIFTGAISDDERRALIETLADPDSAPEAKIRTIDSFMNQQSYNLKSLGRQYNIDTSFIDEMIGKDSKPQPKTDTSTLRSQAQQAIAAGRDAASVATMFKQMTGEDL